MDWPGLPEWSTEELVTLDRLEQVQKALAWVFARQPRISNLNGLLVPDYGVGAVVDYLYVDPAYPGSSWEDNWARYTVNLPAIFDELYAVSLTPASSANGALAVTVSNESASGFLVTAHDSGGTALQGHALWLVVVGKLKSGVLPAGVGGDDFGVPPKQPLSAYYLKRYDQSISYLHRTIPYLFDLSGNLRTADYGWGAFSGYVLVDPAAWPGYNGAGANYGIYTLPFPAGLSDLTGLIVQPASGANGAIQASVSDESTGGCTVFVYDSGGTPIQVHALWVTVIGPLTSGVGLTLPDRTFGLTSWTPTTEITSARLQRWTDALYYHLRRTPLLFDWGGELAPDAMGHVLLAGYEPIDPYSYPGYSGTGQRYGFYQVTPRYPAMEELRGIKLQPASGANAWMVTSVSHESAGGALAFSWDTGGAAIQGHAQWVFMLGTEKR